MLDVWFKLSDVVPRLLKSRLRDAFLGQVDVRLWTVGGRTSIFRMSNPALSLKGPYEPL